MRPNVFLKAHTSKMDTTGNETNTIEGDSDSEFDFGFWRQRSPPVPESQQANTESVEATVPMEGGVTLSHVAVSAGDDISHAQPSLFGPFESQDESAAPSGYEFTTADFDFPEQSTISGPAGSSTAHLDVTASVEEAMNIDDEGNLEHQSISAPATGPAALSEFALNQHQRQMTASTDQDEFEPFYSVPRSNRWLLRENVRKGNPVKTTPYDFDNSGDYDPNEDRQPRRRRSSKKTRGGRRASGRQSRVETSPVQPTSDQDESVAGTGSPKDTGSGAQLVDYPESSGVEDSEEEDAEDLDDRSAEALNRRKKRTPGEAQSPDEELQGGEELSAASLSLESPTKTRLPPSARRHSSTSLSGASPTPSESAYRSANGHRNVSARQRRMPKRASTSPPHEDLASRKRRRETSTPLATDEPQLGMVMEDEVGHRGRVAIVKTGFCHPVKFMHSKLHECDFHDGDLWQHDNSLGVWGRKPKTPTVIKWFDGQGYTELYDGYAEDDIAPDVMCYKCTLRRYFQVICKGHQMRSLGLAASGRLRESPGEQFDMNTRLQHNVPEPDDKYCSVCLRAASFECGAAGQSPDGTDGCGLRLCEDCNGHFRCYDGSLTEYIDARLEFEKDCDQRGVDPAKSEVRTDAELLLEGSILHKTCLAFAEARAIRHRRRRLRAEAAQAAMEGQE